MAKHSTGPWATEGHSLTWSLLDADGHLIAQIHKSGPNAAADARLLTEAPRLLETLELVRGSLKFDREDDVSNEVLRRVEEVIARAKA